MSDVGTTLRFVLGDQLSRDLSSLADADADGDVILLCEVWDEATYVRHHKKKIAFLFSAMRHFAGELEEQGVKVRYVRLDDEGNSGSLGREVARALKTGRFDRVIVTKPGEWRLLKEMETWAQRFGCEVELREDARFIASIEDFAVWAEGRKSLRMEYFYREMRRRTGLLMDEDAPAGGEWNYDKDNRKALPRSVTPPRRKTFCEDKITEEVIALVKDRFADHFGELDDIGFAVTREGAEAALDHFIEDILPGFGAYQDAMAIGEPWLWHSLLSVYLNCGLLDPMDLCRRAEATWKAGNAPLNAVEGFIRQILGWREYVRGLYWLKMPDYKDTNFLGADRRLPEFYWTGETDMRCMADAIGQTRRHAYAHHIQRLMVTGNFALIAGLDPKAVNEWYMVVYADAYEWVELPNTHGMALYADGGVIASKPYAASGNYINKMSDYCRSCRYDVKARTGPDACPFNSLYWDFLARSEDALRENPRMRLIYSQLDRMADDELGNIREAATGFLDEIGAVRSAD